MSTIDGPLGAATSGTTLDLKSPAQTGSARIRGDLVGQLGLASVLSGGLLLCLAAAHTNTLLPETIRPVTTPQTRALAGAFAGISLHLKSGEILGAVSLMFIGYIAAVRHAERLTPRWVLATIGVFLTIVLLAPPLLSTDLFSYQEYARMFFGLHVNPYTNNSQVLALDPLLPYIGAKWIHTPTVYGPLFTLLSGLFEKTSSTDAIAFSAYAYKVIAALSCVGIIAMTWKAAKLRGLNPVRGAALFGLNPLVILYGVGGGHNDMLMMLFATAGVWALLAHRERASGALTVTAAAIKLTGGLMLPFALASQSGLEAGARRRNVAFGAAVALVVTLGAGIAIFGTRLTQMFNTLSQVQGEGGWQSPPGFLSQALGWQTASHDISLLFGVAFTAICLRLLWRVFQGQLDWLDGAAWATFWLLLASSAILPWYVSWLLVPVALCTQRKLWTATLWFSGWVQLTTMIAYLPHPPTILGFHTG